MPRCLVYGPRETDVVSIVRRACPSAVITMVDEVGAIAGVFSEDPTEKLRTAGLHITLLEENIHGVVWRPFHIRGSPGSPAGTDEKIAEILQRRFNASLREEKHQFLIPIPVLSAPGSINTGEASRHEYHLLLQALTRIERVLKENGINPELGLMRW